MLLAIDVGNSETIIGLFEADRLHERWRIATVQDRTADELALLLGGFLELEGLSFPSAVTGFAVSSVVPRLTPTLREVAERYLDIPPLLVEPGVRTGLPVLTDNPREVGADRVVNAVAAFDRYGGPVVVVDFGTATTVDAISARGELLGNAIAPGVAISLEALSARAAQLSRVELVAPKSAIGRNTVTSLQSGVMFGTGGQVDGLVRRVIAELGGHATVVATGGLAAAMLAVCETIDEHDPWLTLHGIRLIHERNRGGRGDD